MAVLAGRIPVRVGGVEKDAPLPFQVLFQAGRLDGGGGIGEVEKGCELRGAFVGQKKGVISELVDVTWQMAAQGEMLSDPDQLAIEAE